MYKDKAHDALRGCWHSLAIIWLIYGIVVSISGSILYGILSLAIAGPLAFSLSSIALKTMRYQETSVSDLLEGFQINVVNNIVTGLLQSLFVFLWSLLFVIPGVIKSYAYAMTFFIINDNPDISPMDALHESERLMDGHKMELFMLDLSFIFWHLLVIVTFGIASLWVAPYVHASHAAFYEELKKNA